MQCVGMRKQRELEIKMHLNVTTNLNVLSLEKDLVHFYCYLSSVLVHASVPCYS